MTWTSDTVAKLLAGVSIGLTGSQLAESLGDGFTRNMCISKASRMGVQLRSGMLAAKKPKKHHSPREVKPRPMMMPSVPPEPMVILQLGAHHCRWPLGDAPPGHADQIKFCADQAEFGFPYCTAHLQAAYMPDPRRLNQQAKR